MQTIFCYADKVSKKIDKWLEDNEVKPNTKKYCVPDIKKELKENLPNISFAPVTFENDLELIVKPNGKKIVNDDLKKAMAAISK